MKWKIGNIEIKNQIVLAPMAGVSNPAYIKICEEMGVGYAVTELLSSEAIIRGNKKTFDMLNGINNIKIPVAIQLFGANSDTMASAAKILIDRFKVKIIDINMGCPVPKVAIHAKSGSGLLKDVNKIYEMVKKVVENVDVPVTVKIRSGWDKNSINAIEVAKIIEKAGASAIIVHPRTRSESYTNVADWNIIKEVKENVNIPVIGNGDVKSCIDAKRMLDETGCDAVMIGRALMGNPWLIKECVLYLEKEMIPHKVSDKEKIYMLKKYFKSLVKYCGEKRAVLEIRSHIGWFLKGISNINQDKIYLMKAESYEIFNNKINDLIKKCN